MAKSCSCPPPQIDAVSESQIAFWTTVAQLVPIVGGAVLVAALAAGRRQFRDDPPMVLGFEVGTFTGLALPLAAVEAIPLVALLTGNAPPQPVGLGMVVVICAFTVGAPFLASYLRFAVWATQPVTRLLERMIAATPLGVNRLSHGMARQRLGQLMDSTMACQKLPVA